MAKTKTAASSAAVVEETTTKTWGKYNRRKWSVPSKRAKNYAEERVAKVHQRGPREGHALTDFESGLRSGYLQCQKDHAGLYKYKQGAQMGLKGQELIDYSQKKLPKKK